MSSTGPQLGISGVATGIDASSLIAKIMAFESQPLNLLNNQISALKQQENAWNPLRGLFQALHDAAAALAGDDAWNPQQVSVSDTSVLEASAGAGATPGTYTVQPDAAYLAAQGSSDPMARAEQDVSTTTSITDADAPLGYSGTFTLNGVSFTLNGSESLNQIAALINDQTAAAHVRASVLQVYDAATGGTHLALQLLSTKTGAQNGIVYGDATTSSSGGVSLFVDLGILASTADTSAQAAAVKQRAQDAHFVVNGVPMVSDSNTITGAIPGVTITLKNLKQNDQVTLTLTSDESAVEQNVQKFVDAFNNLVRTLRDDTKYDPQSKQGGPLLGNTDILLGQGRLGSDVQAWVSGAGTFQTLAQIGITQSTDGTLAFDTAKFRDAWNRDPASVKAVFTAAGSGVAQRVATDTDAWLKAGGILDAALKSWDARIKALQDRAQAMQEFLQRREQALRDQFNRMEEAISRLQGQAQSLSLALSALFAPPSGSQKS
ncbi:MAG: flagellar filament capping protein FliD [Firmicutes bacterium]|nr:flagellar filament capping protein FliD [Bacillota bacterium]